MTDATTTNKTTSRSRILLVGSAKEAQHLRQLLAGAEADGYHLDWMEDAPTALAALTRGEHAICLIEYPFGCENGFEFLREAQMLGGNTPLILLADNGAAEIDRADMPVGAAECLVKRELTPALLRHVINHALERERLARENQRLRAEARQEAGERRRAEEALQRSEDQLRALLDSNPDCVTVLSPEGKILDLNAAAVALFGAASREEVVDKSIYSFIVSEHQATVEALNAAVLRGENATAEFDLLGPYRARHQMECRAVPLRRHDLQATCVLVTARDVTEQRQSEEASREREARYRLQAQLLDAVGQSVIATLPDGTIFYWNRAAEKMFGWTADEVLGRDILDVAPAESSQEQARQLMEQLARGGDWTGEFTVRRRNGEVFLAWVANTPLLDERGNLAGIIGTSMDLTELKRAEEALRESEARFRRLTEANIIGTFLWDADGNITDANDAFLSMTGYTSKDVEQGSLRWRDLSPPEYAPQDDRILTDIRQRGVAPPQEKECWRKDGSRVPVLLVAASLDGPAHRGVAYTLDLTERRRAERAGQETLAILQAVTEGTTDAVFVKDLHGRYLMINSAGARFIGRSVEDIIGRHDTELFSPDTVQFVLESDQHALTTGETFTTEETISASGVLRTYHATKGPFRDSSGNIIGTIGVSRDITRRKAREQALRESEARFRAMAESFPHGLYLTTPDGETLYANPEVHRQAGMVIPATKIGEWEEAVHPEDRERVVTEWNAALESGGGYNTVHRFLHPDGKTIWVRSRTAPVWVDGALLGYVGMVEDITQVRQLEEQLRQAQKMEAIGRLAGGIAHDFNNLLAVINGYSEIVQMNLPAESTLSDHLGEVRKAGERAAGLTRQLLAFSRKQVLAPKVLDPNQLISELGKMLFRLIGEDIRLETDLHPDVATVFADPGQLEQVLMNLAVNARDAMPRGGRLQLSTRNVSAQDSEFPSTGDLLPIDYVLIEVRDSGGGMTPAVKARIFEPFFTTKGQGEGTGLGLAVVHGIVAQSGGQIEVESEPGNGTTFRIFLPRCEAPAKVADFQAAPSVIPRGAETVLLVEDDEAVRLLIRLVLRDAGYHVLEAPNAEEALALVETHAGAIHLLATDVVLPGLGGRHLAEKIQARIPALRVLYLSGYTDDAVVRHGVLVDKVDILQKPFSTEDLVRKVRAVLDAPYDGETARARGSAGRRLVRM